MRCMKSFLRFGKGGAVAAILMLLCLLAGCASAPAAPPPTQMPPPPITPAPTAFVAPAQMPAPDVPIPQGTEPDPAAEPLPLTGEDPALAPLPTPVPAVPGELNVGLVLENEAVLHPLKCAHRDLISLNELVFESLIDLDDSLCPTGELAESWTMAGDTITFTLRQGITFHSGEPLTALDVVESYNYLRQYGQDSAWYARTSVIKEMLAVNETTVQVEMTNAGFASLYAMTFPVVQRASLTYAMPKGTGPYWYTGYAVDHFVRVESNPLWWKKTATVASVVGWRYATTEQAIEALYAGEIDTLCTRSPSALLFKQLSDYTSVNYATSIYEMLVPNLTNGVMRNKAMREALMYAIDRTAIAEIVYGNMVQESEVPVVPGTYLYETQAAQFNNSPERALMLLHEMGYRDTNGDTMLDEEVDGLLENFTIRLVTYNDTINENRTAAARLIAQQLARVGITVDVETVSIAQLERTIKNGDFDIALVGVNLSFVPDLTALLRHDGKLNYSGYADKPMNNLLQSARQAATAGELSAVYSEIQKKIVTDLPLLGLYFHTGSVISQANVLSLHGLYECNTLSGLENAHLWG